MRWGVCAQIDQAQQIAGAGYDYIELSAAGDLVPDQDEAIWNEKRNAINAMPLRPEAFNSFVRTGKIVGPASDMARLERYVHTALARAAQVGGKIIVFGSGGARDVPDGFDRNEAAEQIRTFLGFCADAHDQTGVIVAIEPLRRAESNIINSVGEGAGYVRAIGRPGVRNLADTFHMEADHEPLSAILDNGDTLAHTHTADSGRLAPGTGTYDHAAFLGALKTAGYDDRLSIECKWNDFAAEIGPALVHLKRAHASV